MNFKTTLLLAIVLLVAGIAYFVTSREQPAAPTKTDTQAKLVTLVSADIQKITITSADGKAVVLERANGDWKITAPVSAMAEKWSVEDLLTSLTGLTSRGETAVQDADKAALGLDKPTKVQIAGKDGKGVDLTFGGRSAVGDVTYVLAGDGKSAKIVAAEVLDKLDEPLKKYRDMRLEDVNSNDVKQVIVRRPEGELKFQKDGEKWRMTAPQQMPVEAFEMTDVISALTNLRATEFVAEDGKDAAKYGLAQPKYSGLVSTAAPATQPSTSAPSFVTTRIGSYDDIRKQSVYAMARDNGPIAKVNAGVIRQLSKRPLEFRDKTVLELDPSTVQSVALTGDLPATTQPTTREASKTTTTVLRNVTAEVQGPPTPATTKAATTTSTQPAPAPWVYSDTKAPADEAKVKDLLDAFKSLRATSYLEVMPQVKAQAIYTVTIKTVAAGGAAATREIKITDRGETGSPVGQYEGLIFEVDRELLAKLKLR